MKRYLIKTKANLNRCINNNKGSTIYEIVIAFVVILVVLAIIYKMISFSSELRMEAVDIRNAQLEFESELYKKTPDTTKISVKKYVIKENSNTHNKMPVFVLKLDEEKTDVEANFMIESSGSGEVSQQNTLNLMDIVADGYSSKNSNVTIIPKAMKFRFGTD
ncbi:MAG: hypothetical protein K6E27_06705 [Eubacterium sp.]|nr:hypothetical protein [Eubacterium sp.]